MSDDELREYVGSVKWHFAKTMPKDPHHYHLKSEALGVDRFNAFVLVIRERGQWRIWKGKHLHSYFVLDNHCYWSMGSSLEVTKLINRQSLVDVKGLDLPLLAVR
jgi:hypothetical protein